MKLHKEQRLYLKANKKKILIDFVASIPAMITKAATRDNIHHGFIANSLGDKKIKRYPDFNWSILRSKKYFNYCSNYGSF